MRIPVPNNRLVTLTLAGALLTTLVAGALAVPIDGLTGGSDATAPTTSNASQSAAAAPTPNAEFTPAVQTQSAYGEDEHGEEQEEDEHGEEHEGGEYGE